MIQGVGAECTGCNVCVAKCKMGAITPQKDENGFWYPVVDEEKCINCGLCIKSCPQKDIGRKEKQYLAHSYVAWSKNESIRKTSSSGGVFSEIGRYILDNGGYVVGASLTDDMRGVHHIIINDYNGLEKLKGSKYVQSFIDFNIYLEIEKLLNDKKLVLFSGTPCQVAGLNHYLGRSYETLVVLDVVCHGVPSTLAWQKYIDFQEEKFGQILTNANFRSKKNGWKKFELRLSFSNEEYSSWFNEDPYGKSFINNMFLRKSCYKCLFKEKVREADISLGDFWKISEKYDSDDKGCSLVISNSRKGERVIDAISEQIFREPIDISEAYPGNYALYKSSHYFEKRDEAFRLLKKTRFDIVVDRYTRKSILRRIVSKIKTIVQMRVRNSK